MHEFMALEPFLVFLQYRGAFKARVCASETISCLVATNMLNPQLRSKTHVFEGFVPFRRRTQPVAETSIGVHLIECFRIVGLYTNYLKDFNAPFRSKTHSLGIFAPFRCSTTSLWFCTTYFTSKTRVSGGFTPFR